MIIEFFWFGVRRIPQDRLMPLLDWAVKQYGPNEVSPVVRLANELEKANLKDEDGWDKVCIREKKITGIYYRELPQP